VVYKKMVLEYTVKEKEQKETMKGNLQGEKRKK
jgi:hypothetical protein